MLPLLYSLLLALAAPSSLAVADLRYTSTKYGFGVDRPDETWGWLADEGHGLDLFTWMLFPRGGVSDTSLTVFVGAWDGKQSVAALRDAERARLAQGGAQNLVTGAGRLAQRESAWVRGAYTSAAGVAQHIEYAYVTNASYFYTLQSIHAAANDAGRAALAQIVDTFALVDPEPIASDESSSTWEALAAKCGSELPWCRDWAEAADRAEREHKLVFVMYENYAGLDLPDLAASGVLSDPDLVALLQERFVVLRLEAETPAPFRAHDAFGLSEHSWGTSFFFVSANGRVLRECGVSNASVLDEVGRRVLAETKSGPALATDGKKRHEWAALLVRRGELERASDLLARDDSFQGNRLRAAICRRNREGARALDLLRKCRPGLDRELQCELAVDEATLLMRMGRSTEAEAKFQRAVEKCPTGPRAAEALFWLGVFEVMREGIVEPAQHWTRAVAEHPNDPWTFKAAANLAHKGALVWNQELLEWPSTADIAGISPPALAALPPERAELAERTAVEWLVKNQRADGSWSSPTDDFAFDQALYTPATTAICGWSLLAHLDQKACKAAIDKAVANTLARHEAGELEPGGKAGDTYSIWSRTFVMWFFAECVRLRAGHDSRLRPEIDELARSISASQHSGGGWPYVTFPGDPAGEGFDPSASFLTAGVLLALVAARDLGAQVSAATLERGFAFLERMQRPDGSFRYMPESPERNAGRWPESGGRGPVCALALLRGGNAQIEAVRTALDGFLAGRAELKAQWHKELCHTGTDGQGSHYLFYDYLFAHVALNELPQRERAKYREAILRDVLAARFSDGSFEDMPGLGRPYGTAMAALVLQADSPPR